MFLRILWLGMVAIWGTSDAFALIERRVDRHFEISAVASLRIDTFSGSVHVNQGDSSAIEITVIEQCDVEKEATMEERLRNLDLRIEQKASEVSITTRYHRHLAWTWQAWPPVMLTYEIKVPRRCDVEVITRDGSIVVGALQGRVSLTNESGKIFTGEIDGQVKARSYSGEIAVTACTGPVDVRTTSGNIIVGRAKGRTQLTSAGGYIDLQEAAGEVAIRGNGTDAKIGFASPIKAGADIATSGGNIVLTMDNTSACTLDLTSSVFGRVKARHITIVATSGGLNHSFLVGTVNGGGPRIVANADGGNVLVRGLDPIPAVGVTDVPASPTQ